ncbi:MAG: hypothetical protein ACPGUZ_00740 [Holosporaceae bacterium]
MPKKIFIRLLLCSSLHTVKLFAPPADEQDLPATPIMQKAQETVKKAGELARLTLQHTPTYCTDKLTPKGAALTVSVLAARTFYTYYSQNAPKPATPISPALRLHQDQKSQASLFLTETPHAKAFQPAYKAHFLQNMPSQSLTQAVIESLKTDV